MDIPDRDNLESMSRTDIQRLCKDNNIKANMRTDEMINALCELVNGNADVPRPRAVSSQPAASSKRVSSQTKPPSKKAALQPSESNSNTDVESAASTPAPAITTRRKAKDLQMHLGKGRPVIAGGSGARNITVSIGTRSVSTSKARVSSKRVKASQMLNEVITEEDEEQNIDVSRQDDKPSNQLAHPSSARPLASSLDLTAPREDDEPLQLTPSQLPTPAPSQPSGQHLQLSLPQFSALESRVTALETDTAPAFLQRFETTLALIPQIQLQLAHLPQLELQISQISTLQETVQHLETSHTHAQQKISQLTIIQSELQAKTDELFNTVQELNDKMAALTSENEGLKGRIAELESKDKMNDVSMSSVIIHDTPPPVSKVVPPQPKAIHYSTAADLPHPSPSQPTLGKRQRVDTPDASMEDPQPHGDPELDAIDRVRRPLKKKARLDTGEVITRLTAEPVVASRPVEKPSKPVVPRRKGSFGLDPNDDDSASFTLFGAGGAGPSSTSTPKPSTSQNPASPPGFINASKNALPPVEPKTKIQDSELHGMEQFLRLDGLGEEVTPQVDAPHTPPSRVGAINDPNFFGGPLPVFAQEPASDLPFPLIPSTPTAPSMPPPSISTPMLGEAWRPGYNTQSSAPTTPAAEASTSNVNGFTFRAGGRKERNDQYNPYFTPQRSSSGGRMRTGLTPSKGFTMTLKSPIAEEDEAASKTATIDEVEEKEEGIEKSPPQLRTLYGTELAGDTRFGDYGRELGSSKGWKWTR